MKKYYLIIATLFTIQIASVSADEICSIKTTYVYDLKCSYITTSSVIVTDYLYGHPVNACPAFYYGYSLVAGYTMAINPITIQNCGWEPEAKYNVFQHPHSPSGSNRIVFSSRSTDSDSDIAKYEWKVDGVVQATTNPSFTMYNNMRPKTVNVTLTVTDTTGLKDSISKDVDLLPWSCEEPCVLF